MIRRTDRMADRTIDRTRTPAARSAGRRAGGAVLALLLAALLLALAALPALAQEKTLVWDRFDVDIVVQPDGSFDVCEHQTIDFTRGSFTFGYRSIPAGQLANIANWSLTDDSGNRYTPGRSGAYSFDVEYTGGSYDVNWSFPPISGQSETYHLCYTVQGGLRYYEGGDQLWWKAIYGDRPFPVLDATVRVLLPPGATVQEYAAYINSADARPRVEARMVTETTTSAVGTPSTEERNGVDFVLTDSLQAGEELEVRVEFPKGFVAGAAPNWQRGADAAAAARAEEIVFQNRWQPIATLAMCVLGLLFGLGGPAGLYVLWYNRGRTKPVPQVADYLPEPPSALAPGIAGTLLDETADMEDIVATLVDLARRKAISITEDNVQSLFSMKTDYIYRRERTDVPLAAHEQVLLGELFEGRDEVRLSSLKNNFYTKVPRIKTALYEAAVAANLFPSNPEGTRTLYSVLGMLAMAAAVGVGFLGITALGWLTPAAVLPGVGLGVVAVGLLILAKYMPRKTDSGAEEAAKWEAFRTYLRKIDQYTDIEAQKEIWDRWLPYAIAFGVDRQYMAKFAAIDAPAPGWYIPSPTLYGPYRGWYYGMGGSGGGPVTAGHGWGGSGGGGFPGGGGSSSGGGGGLSDMSRGMGGSLTAMSAGLAGMFSAASSTFTSRPASSSGGGGGWGGGGFSGGGSFGGGGGGGGSGGFG
jgi:uncharacterized membrane protein YgcG